METLKRFMDGNVVKFASIAAYASCSIGMIILNKSILSRFLFRNTLFLLVVQNFLALFWTLVAAKLPTLTLKRVLQWLPINVAFLLMLYTGFRGLEFLKLSMVTVLKNCTNILILIADWYLYGQTVNARVRTVYRASLCIPFILSDSLSKTLVVSIGCMCCRS